MVNFLSNLDCYIVSFFSSFYFLNAFQTDNSLMILVWAEYVLT